MTKGLLSAERAVLASPFLLQALNTAGSAVWCWNVGSDSVEVCSHFFSLLKGLDCNAERSDYPRQGDVFYLPNLAAWSDHFPADKRESLLLALQKSALDEMPFQFEFSPAPGGGQEEGGRLVLSAQWLKQQDGAAYLYGVLRDSGEQREQLIDSQQQALRLLLDSMRSAILYLDRWGIVKDSNRLANELFGSNTLCDKSFIDIANHWDEPFERQREIMQVIRSGIAVHGSQESIRAGQTEQWFSVDKIPTKDTEGQVNGLLLVMTDVTEGIRQNMALKESDALYKTFIASSSDAIWRFDLREPVDISLPLAEQQQQISEQSFLSECNQAFAQMFGDQSPASLLGLRIKAMGSHYHFSDIGEFIRANYHLNNYEIYVHDHTGGESFLLMSSVGIIENGQLLKIWGTTRDITQHKRYQAKLEYQAMHDSLTQLPNRNYLYREIESDLDSRGSQQMMALMLIDLDRFKEINDTLGHHAGDKLLQQVGPRLNSEINSGAKDMSGLVARLGGDEFAVWLPHVRNAQHAVVFAHRLLDALREEFDIDGFHAEISASIGIAISPDQAADVSTLMRYADVAMYRAKAEMLGVAVYKTEFDPHSTKRLAMMSELGRALRNEQLFLHFQPKINLASGRVTGFESLLRWQHPQLGFVSPAEFIPIVEMTELIHPMTLWVLETSIKQCKAWREQGFCINIAVNLSARNLLDESIALQVSKLLSQYDLPAEALELEITESMIMSDPMRAMRVLESIHQLGVKLSIDDFGTGYSSLAYLKRLPVDTLKIDYSFVLNMLEDKQDEIIVNSTINLAHNLGLQVVAEGVESEAVLQRLRELGCDRAQGFYISRPVAREAAECWLRESEWVDRGQIDTIELGSA